MPWLKTLADRIAAIRHLAANAPAAWSVEQVADATRRAKKADGEQILDSLPAPL